MEFTTTTSATKKKEERKVINFEILRWTDKRTHDTYYWLSGKYFVTLSACLRFEFLLLTEYYSFEIMRFILLFLDSILQYTILNLWQNNLLIRGLAFEWRAFSLFMFNNYQWLRNLMTKSRANVFWI